MVSHQKMQLRKEILSLNPLRDLIILLNHAPGKFSLDTSKAKENKSDKFDSLFDDNQVEDKHDDLPF